MVDLKLFKTLKIIVYPPSKLNKIFHFSLFLLSFYLAFYLFTCYNQMDNLTSIYKSDAYRNIRDSFLSMYSFFMNMYPLIYCGIISYEKRAIEKLMKFLSCKQLKNNLIIISFTATLLAVLPMIVLILSYAYLYERSFNIYNSIIIFLSISPLWFLFNILLVLYLIISFRNDMMIIIIWLYTLLIFCNVGALVDEYLSGKYDQKFLFFRHSSPMNYLYSMNNFSSFNIKYSCDWSLAYFFASLILYFMLTKKQFMKFFRFSIDKQNI